MADLERSNPGELAAIKTQTLVTPPVAASTVWPVR
jgi:hypothetical protein